MRLSLMCDQGRVFSVSKIICYWSAMSVNQDVGLSSIRWRAINRQDMPPAAAACRENPYRHEEPGQLVPIKIIDQQCFISN